MKALIASVSMLVMAPIAWANVTYTYTGNDYNQITDEPIPAGTAFNTTQRITGTLTFSSPLADQAFGAVSPASLSFSNGEHVFDAADTFRLELTVVGGLITSWAIVLAEGDLVSAGDQRRLLDTQFFGSGGNNFDSGTVVEALTGLPSLTLGDDEGLVNNAPGTWTVSTVAEPDSMALVFAALGASWFASRKKKRTTSVV